MNIKPICVSYNINRKFGYNATEVISIECEEDFKTRYIDVYLYADNVRNTVDISGSTVTARMVTTPEYDSLLLSDNVACEVAETGHIIIPIDSAVIAAYPCDFLVEVHIQNGENVLVLPFPLWVSVRASILDNAGVTPESQGTVPKLLKDATKTLEDAEAAIENAASLKESLSNKVQSIGSQSQTGDNDKYPSVTAVRDYVNTKTDDLQDYIENDLDEFDEVKVSKPSTSPNGTNGQLLRTKGDGTTEWVDVIDSTLSTQGAAAEAKTTGDKMANTNKDLSFFIGSSDVLEGVTFEQGSISYITRWSDYSLNESSTRIRAFIDLNNLSGITIVPCNGYGFTYAVFDANHNLLSGSAPFIDENRTLTFSAAATNLRIVLHKVGNGNISPSEAVNIKVYDRDYTLKRIGDTAKGASEAVASKANAATTLAGYGITDAYTKAEADSRFFAKAAIGFIDGTNYSAPILEFNTTTGNVTVNKCFLLGANGARYQISSAQTIAYDKGSGVATQTLVYDTSDSTVKVFYTSPSANKTDDSKHIILAYYYRTRIVNGIIFTNLSYSIDGKYIGNMPKDISPSFPDGQIVKLKVCAYNVGEYSYGSKPAVSAETAAEIIGKYRSFYSKENCDILGLCENRQVLKSVLPNGLSTDPKTAEEIYDYLYPIKYGFYDSMWAFSRYGISETSSSRFNTTDRGVGDADYIKGNLSINGLNVFFMVVHLSPNSLATRLAQYEELIAMLNQHDYFICFGDFNAKGGTVDGVTYTAQDEFDVLLDEGYHIANGGYLGLMTTFKGATGTDNQKLDNIVTSDNIIIANSYVPDVYDSLTSDHVPLIAELVIRGSHSVVTDYYVLTNQDKSDIADIVLGELPTTQGVQYGN